MMPSRLLAQEAEKEKTLESIIESVIDLLGDDVDASAVTEDLQDLAENPININTSGEGELSKLIFINDIQIHNLITHRNKYGNFLSIYEMTAIEGFTEDIVKLMEPFIRFDKAETELKSPVESIKNGNHQLILRTQALLQKQDGYLPRENGIAPFEGGPLRYYTRYKFKSQRITGGFTAESDPGEAFFKGSNKTGFDYYSGNISAKLSQTVEKITLGDYYISCGQGLVLGQGFTLGKSANTQLVAKNSSGIKPWTSTDENFYFRGAGVTLRARDSRINLFASSKKHDANIETGPNGETGFTSLQNSGYHRTISEIENEKTVRNSVFGANFVHYFRRLKLGATFLYQRFDKPQLPSAQLYKLYAFTGRENLNMGVDYMYSIKSLTLFGEGAISKSGGLALIQGANLKLNNQVGLTMVYRNYDKRYYSFWAGSFGESGNTQNKSGLYVGLRLLPAKKIVISAYTDIYSFKWINYSTSAPSRGWDFLFQTDYRISKRMSVYVRVKTEEKEQKVKLQNIYVNQPALTQKIRLHYQFSLSEHIMLKSRIEHCYFRNTTDENGLMLFQDIQFIPVSGRENISLRVAWFNTDGYNSRIYAYENDLLYNFSIPSFSGKGMRAYINAKYTISDKLAVWFKLAHTLYSGVEKISSGYSEIAGNQKTEFKFQLQLKI